MTRTLVVAAALLSSSTAWASCEWTGSPLAFVMCLNDAVTDAATRLGAVEADIELSNIRAVATYDAITERCADGSKPAYVPRSYVGLTGDDVCAELVGAESSGCSAVRFVAVETDGQLDPYGPHDIACGAPLEYPWPWGYEHPQPTTNADGWARGNTQVVCCAD